MEEDRTLEEIYQRIAFLIEEKFKIKNYSFYEAKKRGLEKLLPIGLDESYCKSEVYKDATSCRAYRLKQTILGRPWIWGSECEKFELKSNLARLCIPFIFEEETRYILQVLVFPEEFEEVRKNTEELKLYLNHILPIVEIKKLLQTLKEQSIKDALTGLYNRHFLNEYLIKTSELCLRHGHSLGILMIDIDFFKKVNDQFGHDVGDEVLKQIAGIIHKKFRKADVVVRYGGEEFLVVLHNVEEQKLIELAEELRREVSQTPLKISSGEIYKTISIGIAIFPKDSKDIREVIKFADIGLYHAKKTGRNKIVRFTRALIQTEF